MTPRKSKTSLPLTDVDALLAHTSHGPAAVLAHAGSHAGAAPIPAALQEVSASASGFAAMAPTQGGFAALNIPTTPGGTIVTPPNIVDLLTPHWQKAINEATAANQFYLVGRAGGMSLDVTEVWKDYIGRNVHVGVFDSGVEKTHADLDANYDATREVAGTDAAPETNDNHGTPVAGIIAAENNGTGTVGIAYGAKITSVDVGDQKPGSSANVASHYEVLPHMQDFDVVNNSWATGYLYGRLASPAFFQSFIDAANVGRNGLGTIVVQAAGNDGAGADGHWDANMRSQTNLRQNITVAAVEGNGHVANFSNPGASLLVSAFGTSDHVNTTDRTGAAGYSMGDTTGFNGTSAATPQVAAIAALMLEANPTLGWRDVQTIMSLTARHVGSDIGQPHASYELNNWGYNKADNWNGGGQHFSNDYGYGLIDALAAVRLAETWNKQSTSANEINAVAQVNLGTTAIPSTGAPLRFDVTLGADVDLEALQLELGLKHPRLADLTVQIRSPEGTWSTLMWRPGDTDADADGKIEGDQPIGTWEFMSNAFRGEHSAGVWTIEVRDTVDSGSAADRGTLSYAKITASGGAQSIHDNFYFTNEAGETIAAANAAGDFSRNLITDTDGGIDTLNAAAVTSNVTLDLVAGGTSWIQGKAITLAAGTVIENAIGGDGNDVLRGNELANYLYGGRGNDSIVGGGGDDTINAYRGNDTIEGGAGGDLILGADGTDTAAYLTSTAGVQVDLNRVAQTGGHAQGDQLYSIESVTGSFYADVLTGNAQNNMLRGDAGADRLYGGGGNDTLDGGAGVDIMLGGAGDDRYIVNSTYDIVQESTVQSSGLFKTEVDSGGNDTIGTTLLSYDLSASSSALTAGITGAKLIGTVENLVYLGTGNFKGTGNAVANSLVGANGADSLDGGAGDDKLSGGNGNDELVDHLGQNQMFGGAGNDYLATYATGNTLDGGSDADTIVSATAGNTILGGAGNDYILCYGGAGRDVISGGAGADQFVFNNAALHTDTFHATIADFGVAANEATLDTLNLGEMGVTSIDQLHFTDTATGTTISWGNGNDITLENVSAAQIQSWQIVMW